VITESGKRRIKSEKLGPDNYRDKREKIKRRGGVEFKISH
jgi:hypothetical protein